MTGTRRPTRHTLVVVLLLTLVAAACSSSGDDGDVGTDGPTASQTSDQDGSQAEPADGESEVEPTTSSDTAADGGTLLMGYSTNPTNLDPARSTSGGDRIFLFPIYDRLIRLTSAGEPQPQLAESWTFADDGLSVEFTLREDVSFHDGEPFNAEAVAANIERGKTLDGSTVAGSLAPIESVEVLDDFTVRFNTPDGSGSILRTMGGRPGMMVSPAAFDADFETGPVGAGPYRLTEFLPDDRVVYEPVEDYYDPDNQTLGGLEVVVLPDDATRLNAVRTGEIDMTFIRPFQVEEAEAAGINVTPNPGLIWYHAGLNSSRSEFGDVRVRQALNHAVNRQEMTDTLLAGFCTPSLQPVPEGVIGHADSVGPDYYEYDPDRARELLAEAGLADGFEFTAAVVNPTLFVQIAESIQAQLAEVGVTMNLDVAPVPDVNNAYFVEGTADAYVGLWLGANDPSEMVSSLYLPDGFNNPGELSTDSIRDLYSQTLTETDDDSRSEVFQQLVQEAVDLNYHVGVCNVQTPIAHNDRVQDIGDDTPTWQWDFRGVHVSE